MAEQETQAERAGDRKNFWTNLREIPLVEKILAPIALLIIIGWLMTGKLFWQTIFRVWFPTLSFLGALLVATLVILKLFGIRALHPKIEKHVIPIGSLVPIVGYLVTSLATVQSFLTIGGSIALAYISATTYWRKHIPEFATQPLGEEEGEGPEPEAAEESPEAPGDESKPEP